MFNARTTAATTLPIFLSGCVGDANTLIAASGITVVSYFIAPSMVRTGFVAYNQFNKTSSKLFGIKPKLFHGAEDSTATDPNAVKILYDGRDYTKIYKDSYHAFFTLGQLPAIWYAVLCDHPTAAFAALALNFLGPMGIVVAMDNLRKD